MSKQHISTAWYFVFQNRWSLSFPFWPFVPCLQIHNFLFSTKQKCFKNVWSVLCSIPLGPYFKFRAHYLATLKMNTVWPFTSLLYGPFSWGSFIQSCPLDVGTKFLSIWLTESLCIFLCIHNYLNSDMIKHFRPGSQEPKKLIKWVGLLWCYEPNYRQNHCPEDTVVFYISAMQKCSAYSQIDKANGCLTGSNDISSLLLLWAPNMQNMSLPMSICKWKISFFLFFLEEIFW